MKRLMFLGLIAATVMIYGVMVFWSLPALTTQAGGLPFDLRPGGYTPVEASAILTNLSEQQIGFYRDVQHKLDLAFPALSCLTIFFSIAATAPRTFGLWRWVLGLAAIPGTAFDYLENIAVGSMLDLGAKGLTPELVAEASRWTLLKSTSTTIALTLLLALLAWKGINLWRVKAAGA